MDGIIFLKKQQAEKQLLILSINYFPEVHTPEMLFKKKIEVLLQNRSCRLVHAYLKNLQF